MGLLLSLLASRLRVFFQKKNLRAVWSCKEQIADLALGIAAGGVTLPFDIDLHAQWPLFRSLACRPRKEGMVFQMWCLCPQLCMCLAKK